MSFSSRAKEEMTVKLPKQKCCEKARIFGILLFPEALREAVFPSQRK